MSGGSGGSIFGGGGVQLGRYWIPSGALNPFTGESSGFGAGG